MGWYDEENTAKDLNGLITGYAVLMIGGGVEAGFPPVKEAVIYPDGFAFGAGRRLPENGE